jgi:AcrR family transcriptional regulator
VVAKAVDLFNKHGYAATSVGEVADALGMLKGSLYYYISPRKISFS